jgi:acetyltransferase-like isoleucine patch superfamily enzyme
MAGILRHGGPAQATTGEAIVPGLFVRYRRVQQRARGLLLGTWIRLGGGSVGTRLRVDRGVVLRWRPHRGLVLGEDIYLGVGVVIDVPPPARLRLGDHVKLMHYNVVAAAESIEIGAWTQVAEHCSIRDSDHGMATDRPMREQHVSLPTHIGQDVWIGRGSVVLKGTDIGDGAVIGANSVVRGTIEPMGIAVGAPAKVIRLRTSR